MRNTPAALARIGAPADAHSGDTRTGDSVG